MDKTDTTPKTVWTEDTISVKEKQTKSTFEIFKEYTEYSTIQGLIYIFFDYQSKFGQIFWSIVLLLMLILGCYWIGQSYDNWCSNPVTTTVSSIAYPIKNIEFPAVTICSQGANDQVLAAGIIKNLRIFAKEKNIHTELTDYNIPFNLGGVFAQVYSETANTTYAWEYTTNMFDELMDKLYIPFINESFPGITRGDDLFTMFKLLAFPDPDGIIQQLIAQDTPFSPCQVLDLADATPKCDSGFIHDPMNDICYGLYSINIDNDVTRACYFDSELLNFQSEDHVKGFLALQDSGQLRRKAVNMNQGNGNFSEFYYGGNVIFNSVGDVTINNQPFLNLFKSLLLPPTKPSASGKWLLQYKMQPNGSSILRMFPTERYIGSQMWGIVCQKKAYKASNCSDVFKARGLLENILDPDLQKVRLHTKVKVKNLFKDMFKRLDQIRAYDSLIKQLWYSTLPCFDLQDVTSSPDLKYTHSMLIYCEWKGMPMSCSDIFTTFPTDKGMCCSFNLKRADEIFQNTHYTNLIKQIQNSDKELAVKRSNNTSNNIDLSIIPGQNTGLLIMLDAHSDLLSSGSVSLDADTFTGLVTPNGNFPFLSLEGFDINPGQINHIALSATTVDADDGLRSLKPEDRNCRFPDEADFMQFHKNYSYSNCLFECSLINAMKKNETKSVCLPWFYPLPNYEVPMCDPWETTEFNDIMRGEVLECKMCLPDCSTTMYEPVITTAPLSQCNSRNLGISPLCKLDDPNLPLPTKFNSLIINKFQQKFYEVPDYIETDQALSSRNYGKMLPAGDIFPENAHYEAYEKDIAVVQIYFRKSSILLIQTQLTMTWIDFFSNVGGLLGLVLGMGIVSVVELLWLCMRFGAHKFGLIDWVP